MITNVNTTIQKVIDKKLEEQEIQILHKIEDKTTEIVSSAYMSHLANMDVKLTDLTNQKVDTKQSTRLDAIQSQLHEMKNSILGHRSDLNSLNCRIIRLSDSVVYVPQ